MKARIEFKLQDLWIGAFWKTELATEFEDAERYGYHRTDLWICILPTLPIHLTWFRTKIKSCKKDNIYP